MPQRRRAQNRASQRAFRERREKHVKGLEHQLETLNEKHQDLLQSYMSQADNITKLTDRLSRLRAEVKTLKFEQKMAPLDANQQPLTMQNFDAFASVQVVDQSPVLYDGDDGVFYGGYQPSSDDHIGQTNELPDFEDLLRFE